MRVRSRPWFPSPESSYMQLADILWTLLVLFFMVMYFMVFFMVVVDIFADHTLKGWAKALWVIAILIAGPITLLVYLIVRGRSMTERRQAQVKAAEASQKAYIQQAAGTATPADQISTAKSLLDAGTINQTEFDALKAKALA